VYNPEVLARLTGKKSRDVFTKREHLYLTIPGPRGP
jgi:hypothetical protein